ncbi:MAG: DUF2310 family Zn-ribbon-containing protein [Acidobacteria bacterium]|nr:DUF2310 family Zn-ribbon-containing protein [Acidobacteriota bacterium]
MAEVVDRYGPLRSSPPTPSEDLCACPGSPPVMLQAHLTANPLSCFACNLEVPPERLALSEMLAQQLAAWRHDYDELYRLWYTSDELEDRAREQLGDPSNAVNRQGRRLVEALQPYRRSYYWWFVDPAATDGLPAASCPICRAALTDLSGRRVCEECAIVMGA